jgi:predicted AAA+ superfamily ATPase
MAVTNQERVGKALELLRTGLGPFVEREVQERIKQGSVRMETLYRYAEDPKLESKPISDWDSSALLKIMWDTWNDVFRLTLGHAERSLVSEIRDWRNKWAHQEPISSDDADRALDSMGRLLSAVSSPQAEEIGRMKLELRRLVFDEQVRGEKRKAGGSLVEAAASGALRPWREVVTPHADVASGRYQQAEFAADLWQVHMGEGTPEYRDPREFFRRTFLTESLKSLLAGGVRRLLGQGGDPVVQLQTNFGGGKTHSMLALYHLFSGVNPSDLVGVDAILAEAGVKTLPEVKTVVFVGNKVSPGNPVVKPDGTVVRTLWGELAYQLGGRKAYERVLRDDELATNPGDAIRELFNTFGPCLVLIDEWVAYARQLHDNMDLPAGSFETQFSFAQALTESAKLAGNCLLVVSLPASDTQGSPHTQSDDAEVGGIRGREALDRLRNVIGRVESSWRPATAEEGFEIVRRRLFEPLSGAGDYKARDVTARAFAELYRIQSAEFPMECRTVDYEKRIQAAYPIHPEIFDQLYGGWSTLAKFQRTRGVLRLMAAVIHSLWEKDDKNPLILPSMVPIDDSRVQFELTRYLSDNWAPILERDVDGPNSLPRKIDSEQPNLGRLSATRRVSRTIYLGSAPTSNAAHRGIEDRRIKLGCVMPGETPAVFGDALRRLSANATYLYQDGARFWFSTQATVTKLAEDRTEQLKRDADRVALELERRLKSELRNSGDFSRVHPLPRTGADVPDDLDARLVVLPSEYSFSRETGSPAETMAKAILESRGNTPRLFRNTLVFLAADRVRLQDLDEALRKYLAWESILGEKEVLNLDPHQVRQAEEQRKTADSTVTVRLPEAYQWLLVPVQKDPQSELVWESIRLSGNDSLAARASKRLRNEDYLVTHLASVMLRKHLDDVPLWRGRNHIPIRQLRDDFAQYTYLPRLSSPEVLAQAVREGLEKLTWQTDTFAYADGYDEAKDRYQGLVAGSLASVSTDSSGMLVKSHIATRQLEAETPIAYSAGKLDGLKGGLFSGRDSDEGQAAADRNQPETDKRPKRFHGSVVLDPTRVGRDAGKVAEEVIAHLAGQVGAEVIVTMEIEAKLPDGASEQIVRTVNENSRTLKFRDHGFESE